MFDSLDIASDVISAATALAGLILVYLGSLGGGYASFEATQQHAVVHAYKKKAWFAFAGMALAILAAVLAVVAKWCGAVWLQSPAVFLLFVAFCWGVATALLTVLEIK